jgi:prepilin-type N-terminal cleavage/methylation domain-containing protein
MRTAKEKQRKFANHQFCAKKSAGFTLLELLIAVSIFAVLVVLVVGAFGFSTKYQRQIRVDREISQGIRYSISEMANQVTLSWNDVVRNESNVIIQDRIQVGGVDTNRNVYNFAVLASENSPLTVSDNAPGGVLMVRGPDNYCKYFKLLTSGGVSRLAMVVQNSSGCSTSAWLPNTHTFYLTNESINVTMLRFTAFHNVKRNDITGAVSVTPYVKIEIAAENQTGKDEFIIPLESRATATIRNIGRES